MMMVKMGVGVVMHAPGCTPDGTQTTVPSDRPSSFCVSPASVRD